MKRSGIGSADPAPVEAPRTGCGCAPRVGAAAKSYCS